MDLDQPVRKTTTICRIALDGPAASGKTTVGERLARMLDFLMLDTGVMYRAVTLMALRCGIPIEDESAVSALAEEMDIDVLPGTVEDGRIYTILADGQDVTYAIRSPEVDANVSPVSTYAGVRSALTEQQRRIGARGRVVMLGRDIGTVVLPNADLKIYLDASAKERACRRLRDCKARGESLSYQEVLAGVINRDEIDSGREHAPLRAAVDAVVIDSTALTVEEVVNRIELEIRIRKGRTGLTPDV